MTLPAPDQNSLEIFLAKPRGDKLLRLHVSRNTLLAFVFSIVLHLVVLLFVLPNIDLNNSPPSSTIVVELAPQTKSPEPVQIPPQPEVKPESEVKPEPKVITKKPSSKPSKPKQTDFSVPKVLTQESNEKSVPTAPTKPQTPADVPTDMASYIAQQRSKREAVEQDAARQNTAAAAAEIGLTDEQKRDERIKNNLKSGTNGIFSIQRRDAKTASFSFKGWTDYTNVKLKFYEVEASGGEDVRLVMIRRMIAIIREHYDGDFPWESHRLNRTITKSARLEDSAELEDFLMQEFFGANYKLQ